MKIQPIRKHLAILLFAILAVAISACSEKTQPKENTSAIPAENIFQSTNPLVGDYLPQLKFLTGIRAILEDSKGNIWIGNNGIGVLKYDGDAVSNFTKQHQLTKEDTKGNFLGRVFSMGEDTLGNIWFGTAESGLWRYNGKDITNFTAAQGFDSKQVWVIYQSKGGEMWFGGAEPSGVYTFDGSSFVRKY